MNELAGGTQTAVIGTEHTLVTDTSGKLCRLVVDTFNLAAADVLEVRVYGKARSGGTSRLALPVATFANAQGDPIKTSPPIVANVECKPTLKQTAGTGRDFVWSLVSIESADGKLGRAMLTNKVEYDFVNRTVTVYDDDNVTVLKVLSVTSIPNGVREA